MISDGWPDKYVAARARNFDSYVALQLATRGFRIWTWTGISGAIIALCAAYKVFTPQREISDIASISLGISLILIGFRIALAWDQYIYEIDDGLDDKNQIATNNGDLHKEKIIGDIRSIFGFNSKPEDTTRSKSKESISARRFETEMVISPIDPGNSDRYRIFEPPVGTYEIKYQLPNDHLRIMYEFVNGATSDVDAIDIFRKKIFDSGSSAHATAFILGIRRW